MKRKIRFILGGILAVVIVARLLAERKTRSQSKLV